MSLKVPNGGEVGEEMQKKGGQESEKMGQTEGREDDTRERREEGDEKENGRNNCDKREARRKLGSVLGQHSDRAD